ncbi:MAG: transcription antitermination factor NusB [Acetivibrio sp.]
MCTTMKRSELREHLFLMLFRKDFHPEEELKEQALLYLDTLESPKEKDILYLETRFAEILDKLKEIDKMIEEVSVGWKITRIGKIELTAIRLAIFEMKYDEEVPTKVAINEAVDLAKKFGEENSGGFVNGILAKLV